MRGFPAESAVVNLVRAGDLGAYADLTAPLGHTWSLGVEEQFSPAWPLALRAVRPGLALPGPALPAR